MFQRLALVMLFAFVLATVAASCGDDGESEASASISKAEFVEEAEKICIRESDKANARVAPYIEKRERAMGDDESQVDLQADAAKAVILPSVEAQIDQIRDLGVPSGDEEQVDAFLAALENAVDVFREAPLTPRANAAFSRVNRLGRAYGLERCAYG